MFVRTRVNRRKYPRVDVEIQVTVQGGAESLTFKTETRDVSAGGIRVRLDSFIEAQSPVAVVLGLPDGQPPLETVGQVTWCVREKRLLSRKGAAYDTGISLTDLNFAHRERLIRFAQSLLY
jgi:c-di-GMP-binding flagellar brake protein YcgR